MLGASALARIIVRPAMAFAILSMMGNPTTRSKGWFRPRNIILVIALAIVATLSWAVFEVWQLHNADPVISVNYREQFRQKSMQLAGITLEEGEQSWTLMCEANSLSGKIEEELKRDPASPDFLPRFVRDSGRIDFGFVRSGDTLPPDIELERQALRMLRERGFFDALARFEAMPPGLAPADNMDFMNMPLMPESSNARSAAKALAASMRIEAAAGNGDEAVRNFAQMLALARTISLQPTLIFGVISVAIETMAFTELRSLLMEHEFTAGQCEAMLTAMDRHRIAGLKHALEAERVSFYDMIQRHFSDDGRGNGYALPQAAESLGGRAPAPRQLAPWTVSPLASISRRAGRLWLCTTTLWINCSPKRRCDRSSGGSAASTPAHSRRGCHTDTRSWPSSSRRSARPSRDGKPATSNARRHD
jgi:hypothetical protein